MAYNTYEEMILGENTKIHPDLVWFINLYCLVQKIASHQLSSTHAQYIWYQTLAGGYAEILY